MSNIPNNKLHQWCPRVRDSERNRLNIKFEKDTWHRLRRHNVGLFSNGVLIRNQLLSGRVRLIDGGYDGEVVLKFVKVPVGTGHDAVERVNELRVVLTKTQFIDHVREIEATMLDVLPCIPVPVSLRGDVEIALHPIHVHTAVDSAAVPISALGPHSLAELALPRLLQHLIDMVLATTDLDKSMRAGIVEGGRVLLEEVSSEDAVGGGVLNINVEGFAVHGDRDVEVNLHFVADARLNEEVLFFMAREMRGEFVVGEPDAGSEEKDSCEATAGGTGGVGCTSFCWRVGGDIVSKSRRRSERAYHNRRAGGEKGTHERHQRCVHSL